jgi:hypothetical protein
MYVYMHICIYTMSLVVAAVIAIAFAEKPGETLRNLDKPILEKHGANPGNNPGET